MGKKLGPVLFHYQIMIYFLQRFDGFSTFRLLFQNKIADLCVITSLQQNNKDNNSILNNKNKIIELCNQHNMKYYLWSDIKSNRQKYYDLFKTFDVGVVASFGHLIPSHFIQLFPL
jgi:methionyl-tRNA formyltransferase